MGFKITELPSNGLAVEFDGVYSTKTSKAAKDRAFGKNYEKAKNLSYLIIDLSKITSVTFTSSQIRALARTTSTGILKVSPGLIVAIVVPDDLQFGLARVWYAHLNSEENAMVFRNRDEAKKWIWEILSKIS